MDKTMTITVETWNTVTGEKQRYRKALEAVQDHIIDADVLFDPQTEDEHARYQNALSALSLVETALKGGRVRSGQTKTVQALIRRLTPQSGPSTVRLRNGEEVYAKSYRGELFAATYTNLTQAHAKQAQLGNGWTVKHIGRPFYIVKEEQA